MVTVQQIKELREKTGAGMMSCKNALAATSGNFEEAVVHLRKQGEHDGAVRQSKVASEGAVGHYIHAGGKIGVLVEVNCETDFSSNSDTFQQFVKDIAMHIAATNPRWISRDDVPTAVLAQERSIIGERIQNKPPEIVDKIVEGKLNRFYREHCLLEQLFVKDQNISITDLTGQLISQIGEKVVIKRFSRYVLGESS